MKTEYKKTYNNYDIVVNKLTCLLEEKNLIIVEKKNNKNTLMKNRRVVERVFGDLKYRELEDYYELLKLILDKK